MARPFTPALNPAGAMPREISERVNRILSGKINSLGEITLAAASATTTPVNDPNIGPFSLIFLFPTTANAAAFMTAVYKSAAIKGQITLTHTANTEIDRTFDYVILG